MKILIVDDEQPARERLTRLIGELEQYSVAGEAATGLEAVQMFNSLQPEIVLLDIRMPSMDGIEAAQHLMSHGTPPAIIFTTAYSDHALEAFETHAVDYLLKPVRVERLEEALLSAKRLTRAQVEGVSDKNAEPLPRTHICVRHRGDLELIPISDIYYFRAEDKYVTLYHKNGQALIEESLVKLKEEFGDQFLRVHRNSLVASQEIGGLIKFDDDKHAIKLKSSPDHVDVSRRHLSTIRRFIKK